MKKKRILFIILFIILSILVLGNKAYAADLDEIENFVVTVDPRMTDGSLDITYEITWKVLDSTSEGPLEWVQIGTPNSNFDTATAITSNITSISKYNGSYVKIVFDKKYYANETLTFKYSIHQSYMYEINGTVCTYEFTPAWFTDSVVKSLTVRWNGDGVVSSTSTGTDGAYLTWTKTNMSKGSKLETKVKYSTDSFSALSVSNSASNAPSGTTYQSSKSSSSISIDFAALFSIFVVVVWVVIIVVLSVNGGGGYYGHSGFYVNYYGGLGGPRHRGGGGGRMCFKLCI